MTEKTILLICLLAAALGDHIIPLQTKDKIFGGSDAQVGEIPWMVPIYRYGTSYGVKCGGSIVNEQWIVTAASCTTFDPSVDYFRIRSGSLHIGWDGFEHIITEIIIHEDYYPINSTAHNIAVMKVDPPFNFSVNTVAPIILRPQGSFSPTGTSTFVAGYGSMQDPGGYAYTLQKANVPILDYNECDYIYVDRVESGQICAVGSEGQDFCWNDIGGPLYYQNELYGIAAWNSGCGYLPGVYTEASQYTDWIVANTPA